jgi:glucose-6-phosphate isomerase
MEIKKILKKRRPDIRHLYDMKGMLYDQKWLKKTANLELYFMYRGIKKKTGLRYDITVIPPKMLGKEFTKTKGHEHSKKYGEVYIVLEGKAIYLIQRCKKNKIEDVYAVKAREGESIIVPPYYGHITINPSKRELVEGNWLCEKCKNIYTLFEKKGGACYYYLKNGWIKNKNYELVPKLRFEKPLKKMMKNLEFLKR